MAQQILQPHTVRRAYYWTIIGYVAKNFFGFGISLLLARFLSPSDYGLVGMVTVLIGILSSLQDCGLGQAVVYFPEDEETLPTAFTATTAMGLILALLALAGAPLVADFYHEPRLTDIVRVLAVTLFFGGLRSVSQGLMSKRMLFREITLLEGIGTMLAGTVGVVMAWRGFGVWSLVVNLVLSQLIQTALAIWMVPPKISASINLPALKKLLRWGLPVTGSGLLWQFYQNSDFLIIGKVIGSAGLGIYTMAFRLSTVVNDKISSVVNRVTFPSLSAMQDEPHRLVDHWFSVSRNLALINFPILVAIAINANDFISVVLGSRWMGAAAPLRFLCVVGAMRTLVSVVNIVINVYGRTDLTFYFSLLNTFALPLSFAIGCKLGGLIGVAIAWCTVYPVVCLIQTIQALRLASTPFRDYAGMLKLPILVSAACALSMLPFGWVMPGGLVRLVVRSGIGVLTYFLCIWSQEEMRNLVKNEFRKRVRSAAR